MAKYMLLLIPIFLLFVFIWAFNSLKNSNTEPTPHIWFSLFLSILISIQAIIGAIRGFKKIKKS
ncbi:hypothetical protein AM499_04585 [Bacillus sp. FJAT-22090]|uniref:hypothetical protein n=1 Tax=Bacillus sp. FJAT-22090 TaxID=1581038 RepID=UPI0006AE9692|nr:hypothetical protein [Bacillus sp. FJAT-22090]ALC85172.1 hypothetical protein AM499_04585 [Bacillus sp. FJAT-22090]